MPQRRSAVAGSFYPADPETLRREIHSMLESATSDYPGDIVGLLAPHAGYVYSGPVAAEAYRHLQNKSYDAVVLIGPSHRIYLKYAAVFPEGSWQTPLGSVRIDADLASEICSAGQECARADATVHMLQGHSGEHSLEVQIPFLQMALGDVPVVPILMGNQSPKSSSTLASAIAHAAGDRRILLVASSDLSHFHTEREARMLDSRIQEAVAIFDAAILWSTIQKEGAEACGAGPLATVMEASRLLGATRAVQLSYATSADVPHGSRDSVVGYLAAAFVKGEA
ncbi:MAG: AmmeMemoRadiSam system protein B [bacterium]